MPDAQIIEIKVPAGIPREYVDLLQAKIEEVLTHGCEDTTRWVATFAALEKLGWSNSLHLFWVAEARRDASLERAQGTSLCGTVETLRQLTMLDEIENCP